MRRFLKYLRLNRSEAVNLQRRAQVISQRMQDRINRVAKVDLAAVDKLHLAIEKLHIR